MKINFDDIIRSTLFKKILKFLGTEDIKSVLRPACFIVRPNIEDKKIIKRIIVLPPHGFTSDKIGLLDPHPEAREVKIKILGKINPVKKGFKPVVKEVRFNFSFKRSIPTEKSSPYAKFSQQDCGVQLKSWKNWFYVVKENGWGNFHSLVNLSNEWVVMLLEKELADQKSIDITPYLKKLSQAQVKKIGDSLQDILLAGDDIFKNKAFVSNVLKFPPKILIPVLIQMLNVQETGKHENCTFFAFLLKFSKNNKMIVVEEVHKAIKLKMAPYYYLEDLERKLR
jgi:hypothetical protein